MFKFELLYGLMSEFRLPFESARLTVGGRVESFSSRIASITVVRGWDCHVLINDKEEVFKLWAVKIAPKGNKMQLQADGLALLLSSNISELRDLDKLIKKLRMLKLKKSKRNVTRPSTPRTFQ